MNTINKNFARIDWIMTNYLDKVFDYMYKFNSELNDELIQQIKKYVQAITKQTFGQLSIGEYKIVRQKLINDYEYGQLIESYLAKISNPNVDKDLIRNIVAQELVSFLNSNSVLSQIQRVACSLLDAFKPLGESSI